MFAIHKHLEGFKATPLALRCQFSFGFFLVFVSVLHQIMVTLSWLAGTPFRGQSPQVRTARACMHESENTWDHMQTQACTLRHLTCTKPHTQEGKPDAYTNTHTSTHIQSPLASCLPTVHLINPCEPDKAGEGTQQPLNTEAGCIRQLRVPVNCIYTLRSRTLSQK